LLIAAAVLPTSALLLTIYLFRPAPPVVGFVLSPSLPAVLTVTGYRPYAPYPTPDGMLWLVAQDATPHWHIYCLNLESGAIEAEVVDDEPVLFNKAAGQLLSVERSPSRIRWLHRLPAGLQTWVADHKLLDWAKPNRRYFQIRTAGQTRPRRIGLFPDGGINAAGSFVSPNTDRILYRSPPQEQRVIDLPSQRILELPPTASSSSGCGWWSNDEFLYFSASGDIALHDLRSDESTVIVTLSDVAAFIERHAPVDVPFAAIELLCIPRDDRNEFLVVGGASAGPPIRLARIDRETHSLAPIDEAAQSTPGAISWQETAAMNGLTIFDVSGNVRAMLEPGATRVNFRAFFYRDRVFFLRDGAIWSMALDGVDAKRIFPREADAE
jgi:hypothetical protein